MVLGSVRISNGQLDHYITWHNCLVNGGDIPRSWILGWLRRWLLVKGCRPISVGLLGCRPDRDPGRDAVLHTLPPHFEASNGI
jgi:hypothetical protein